MKRAAIILIVVGMFAWAVYDFADGTYFNKAENIEQDASVGLNVGDLAPDFELETLNGETMNLSDFQGKRVMLNFWATWCGPCRAEMPDMEELYQEKDIEIVAVNLTSTETNVDDIEPFLDEYGITFPILLDETNGVANLYQIKPIPSSYFINSDGTIHQKVFGLLNYDRMMQMYVNMY